jgi:hypothetical protein
VVAVLVVLSEVCKEFTSSYTLSEELYLLYNFQKTPFFVEGIKTVIFQRHLDFVHHVRNGFRPHNP